MDTMTKLINETVLQATICRVNGGGWNMLMLTTLQGTYILSPYDLLTIDKGCASASEPTLTAEDKEFLKRLEFEGDVEEFYHQGFVVYRNDTPQVYIDIEGQA